MMTLECVALPLCWRYLVGQDWDLRTRAIVLVGCFWLIHCWELMCGCVFVVWKVKAFTYWFERSTKTKFQILTSTFRRESRYVDFLLSTLKSYKNTLNIFKDLIYSPHHYRVVLTPKLAGNYVLKSLLYFIMYQMVFTTPNTKKCCNFKNGHRSKNS